MADALLRKLQQAPKAGLPAPIELSTAPPVETHPDAGWIPAQPAQAPPQPHQVLYAPAPPQQAYMAVGVPPHQMPPPPPRPLQAQVFGEATPEGQLSKPQVDYLTGLLHTSEVEEIALRDIATRDKLLKLVLTALAVLCSLASFLLQGLDGLSADPTVQRVTMALTGATAGLVALAERMPGARRAERYNALANDWRNLSRSLEEGVHYGLPTAYKSPAKFIKTHAATYTALGVKSPALPEKALTAARIKQSAQAQARAPRRASRTFVAQNSSSHLV